MKGGPRYAGSALWLALLGGCTGPALEVGKLRVAELDGGSASDAGGADGARKRPDARQVDDDDDERRECNDQRDCEENSRRRRCYFPNPFAGFCVECVDDRECSCIESEGICRDDRPRPP